MMLMLMLLVVWGQTSTRRRRGGRRLRIDLHSRRPGAPPTDRLQVDVPTAGRWPLSAVPKATYFILLCIWLGSLADDHGANSWEKWAHFCASRMCAEENSKEKCKLGIGDVRRRRGWREMASRSGSIVLHPFFCCVCSNWPPTGNPRVR